MSELQAEIAISDESSVNGYRRGLAFVDVGFSDTNEVSLELAPMPEGGIEFPTATLYLDAVQTLRLAERLAETARRSLPDGYEVTTHE